MIIHVSPSFLKQEAKKLKKSLGISHHDALDEASRKFGFSNFKHFLNFSEKYNSSKEVVLQEVSSKNDTAQKIELEIPGVQNSQIPFSEQLEILKLYQHSDDFQSTCQKWKLMKNEIQASLFNEFLTETGEYEIDFRHPYYIAKKISLSDLRYEIKGNILSVDGDYDLRIKFNGIVPKSLKDEPHFKDRVLSGSFGIKIDKNKVITIPHLNIVQIEDGVVYAGTLKPFARLIPAFRVS